MVIMKNTDIGMTEEQVIKSRELHGANVLIAPPHKSAWDILFGKLKDPLIVILSLATILACMTGGWMEGIGIMIAILLSAGIGFLSEYKAGREFDILNRSDDKIPVKVHRGGRLIHCPREDLVVGDLIIMEHGEEIPADAQVLECSEFSVDQSKFTGEPEPVFKFTSAQTEYWQLMESATYRPDLVLRGSNVLSGDALLKVLAVGMSTEMGATARAASEITDEKTPLQKQLERLSKIIAIFGISASSLLFLVLLLQSWNSGSLSFGTLLGFFMLAVTLIVVTVPEGLPMSVTLSLACSMRKMAQSNCLIRKLHACETIGCATVICTDKTGTLTMNRMEVTGTYFSSINSDGKALIYEAIAVNSTANLNGDEILGNPTEGALLRFLASLNINYVGLRDQVEIVRRWNFSTETKHMATQLSSGRLHLKGAPEIVLGKCAFRIGADEVEKLDSNDRQKLLEEFRAEQSKGRRTLAFAYSDKTVDPVKTTELVFLGFVAISDQVRPEVPEAIQACQRAGIKVKIVTGDTGVTASEIAREIGLAPQIVMDGQTFDSLSDAETAKISETLSVIARARPNDKLKLVNSLRAQGEVVAVTGDGTNDAPALHHADVGISMGKTGTAIAREASDIILLDDSFRSIVNAVLWGRSLYLNIQRFLVFQLTINLAAAVIALSGPFFGIDMPFTVIQMLWVNLIMDTFAALALATEPPTPEVMLVPPRRPGSFIITPAMTVTIIGTALLFVGLFFAIVLSWRRDGISARELTMLFSGFVLLQVWNLFNVRALGGNRSVIFNPPGNMIFTLIVFIIITLQVLITQFGGNLFRTIPLSLSDWLKVGMVTSVVFWSGELSRWHSRLKEASQNRKGASRLCNT